MEFLPSNVEELVTKTQLKGGQIHKVSIQQTPSSGYGIFATSPISYGDILLEIPFSECITIDRILSSPLSVIFDDNPDLLSYPDEILCLGLMYGLYKPQTPSPCEWSQHLEVIPKTYNLTIFWNERELACLRGSMLSHLTAMMLKQIQSDWDNLHHPIALNYPELLSAELTIEDYKWALATVYSRAIGLTRQGQYTRCLVPVLDLVNHHPSATSVTAETFQYNEGDDTILFMSTREYASGDECYASYGNYSNSKLLYTYGFILSSEDPAPRAIDLWSTLSSNIPFATQKQQLLHSNPLTAQQTYDFTGTLRGGGWISRALLATIRVIQATEEEMSDLSHALERNAMVSLRNERATYLSLLELLAMKLKQVRREGREGRSGEFVLLISPTDCRHFTVERKTSRRGSWNKNIIWESTRNSEEDS
jgi:hypothetical protein